MKKLINAVLNRKKYKSLSWWENFMSGHISIGKLTVYGENAMHWGVTYWTKRYGFICFRLPLRCFGDWKPLYFYTSPNATPDASTFYRGSEVMMRCEASLRCKRYGHNFNTDLMYD